MDALAGLTVVDLSSHIAGPYATKLLGDLGARVIKVERPGGDPARLLPPFKDGIEDPNRSALFHFLNTNKESIVVDLKSGSGREVLLGLCRQADLVFVASPPAVVDRLGLDYDSLAAAIRPPVVYLTNFGFDGPYRDYRLSDTVAFAMGGEMFSHGLADREPLKLGGTAALLQGGAMAGIAAMGALHAWEVNGIGQRVDVNLFQVQANSVDRRSSTIMAYRFSGRIQERPPASTTGAVGGVYPTADGFVEVTASFGNYWQRFVDLVDDEALRDPKWSDPFFAASPQAREEADGLVVPWMLERTRGQVWARAREAHAMVAPIFTGEDLYGDPVLRERGYWTEVELPGLGPLPMMGRPYQLEKTPWRIRTPAPAAGADTDRLLAEAGFEPAAVRDLRDRGVVA